VFGFRLNRSRVLNGSCRVPVLPARFNVILHIFREDSDNIYNEV
jgi:hypothetical protein